MKWRGVGLIGVFLFSLGACKKNPTNRLSDPGPNGSVPQTSGIYVIYDDELKTAGGVGFVPGGENQSIDLTDTSFPSRTTHALRYTWNGQDVFDDSPAPGDFQHLFAGYSLLVTPDFSKLDKAPAKDLSAPGYTRLTFFIRGHLSDETRLRIEGPSNGDEDPPTVCKEPNCMELTSLSGNWKKIRLKISPDRFDEVKVFMTMTFQYAQPPRTTVAGGGGVVYVDDIHYEK